MGQEQASLTVSKRAATYLRVSTGRQAEQDLSIPDQRRQIGAYCESRGLQLIAEFVEAGASATDDRRPEFQRMMELTQQRPAPFDVIIVHSFSRFFRDQFQLEFYVRRLARVGVRLISMTQELGDDPMSVMMRQIMALFDEYQSKENSKHTLRAMRENARQGFWNGSLPPLGYRTVAAEQRGARVKKRLEEDPLTAPTVRLMFELARVGDGESGPMGLRQIADYLNAHQIRTRTGRTWSNGTVYDILKRTTYIGRHRFNVYSWRRRVVKPADEVVEVSVPALVSECEFHEVQALLKARSPQLKPPRFVGGTTLLGGIAFCSRCGGAMTLRTGKSGQYRYYACSVRARKGDYGCEGTSIPEEALDNEVVSALESRLLRPERLSELLAKISARRADREERLASRIRELRQLAEEADRRLRRLYGAIEEGVADLSETSLRDRIDELRRSREAALVDVRSFESASSGRIEVTPQTVADLANEARSRLRKPNGGFRRHYVHAFAQRVEVSTREIRIIGKTAVLAKSLAQPRAQTRVAATSAPAVPIFDLRWLPGPDSNRRPSD